VAIKITLNVDPEGGLRAHLWPRGPPLHEIAAARGRYIWAKTVLDAVESWYKLGLIMPTLDPMTMPPHTIVGTADGPTMRLLKAEAFPTAEVLRTTAAFTKAVDLLSRAPREAPSLVILDMEMPKLSGLEVVRMMRERIPSVPVLLLTSESRLGEAAEGVQLGAMDYVLKPVNVRDLLARVALHTAPTTTEVIPPELDPVIPHLVERLHDPQTGRLDAKRVAEFFTLSLADLSRALGKAGTAIYKTPTAETIQPSLRPLESLASGLVRLLGSARLARMWLSSPNPALEQHAPIELLRMGKIDQLTSLVQDLLEGRPA
jgi:DNA-binding response OmpR family regulator